jgi:hypothetical protein
MAMLESFFELRQSKTSIEDHVQTFKIVYADAADQSTLQISTVGKPYFFLKSSDLSERQKFDILVRVDGNIEEFNKILFLTVKLYGTTAEASNATRQKMSIQFYDEHEEEYEYNYEHEDTWYEDEWNEDD